MIRIFTETQEFISRYLGDLSLKKKSSTINKTANAKFNTKRNPNDKSSQACVSFSEVLEEEIQKRK